MRLARLPLVAAAVLWISGSGCKKEVLPPGTVVTFADICDAKYSGKRMTIEGYVGLPSVMLCTDSCKLSLFQSLGGAVELAVSMTVGDSVNEMSKLPDDYKSKDLRIRTADGSIVGEREKVRVSGERAGNGGDECVLIVDLIERP